MNKKIILALIFAIIFPINESMSEEEPVRIFYVPFWFEPAGGIGAYEIETKVQCYGELDISSDNIINIQNIIESSPIGAFTSSDVRVLIIYPDNKRTYIDYKGGILLHGPITRRLTDESRAPLENILEGLTEPVADGAENICS